MHPKRSIKHLQLIQNTIYNCKKRVHILFKSLHWLPVSFSIHFKILALVFKCIYGHKTTTNRLQTVELSFWLFPPKQIIEPAFFLKTCYSCFISLAVILVPQHKTRHWSQNSVRKHPKASVQDFTKVQLVIITSADKYEDNYIKLL